MAASVARSGSSLRGLAIRVVYKHSVSLFCHIIRLHSACFWICFGQGWWGDRQRDNCLWEKSSLQFPRKGGMWPRTGPHGQEEEHGRHEPSLSCCSGGKLLGHLLWVAGKTEMLEFMTGGFVIWFLCPLKSWTTRCEWLYPLVWPSD